MRLEKDFEDLLKLLNKNKVKYCVVGAYAVAFHSKPRFTKDLDILVEPSPENSRKILKVLDEFGFKSLNLKEEDFSDQGNIIQIGYEPVRVDFLTSIEGCVFDEVWKNKRFGKYGRQRVPYIGMNELIKNKTASGRLQDRMDVLQLSRSKEKTSVRKASR